MFCIQNLSLSFQEYYNFDFGCELLKKTGHLQAKTGQIPKKQDSPVKYPADGHPKFKLTRLDTGA